jgi:hypothetical protein
MPSEAPDAGRPIGADGKPLDGAGDGFSLASIASVGIAVVGAVAVGAATSLGGPLAGLAVGAGLGALRGAAVSGLAEAPDPAGTGGFAHYGDATLAGDATGQAPVSLILRHANARQLLLFRRRAAAARAVALRKQQLLLSRRRRRPLPPVVVPLPHPPSVV